MHGDFSQLVTDGRPAVSRVLQQQGRVLLDADWNTAVEVMLRAHRQLAADLIGPHGGPAEGSGFSVTPRDIDGRRDVGLGAGVYYVDGIRVELSPEPEGTPILWSAQPFAPWTELPELPPAPYVVYLDVWERHVDALQDDALREVALGGPDTTTRTEVVWQVRAAGAGDDLVQVGCADFPLADWRRTLRGTLPRLRAWARRDEEDDSPCLAAPESGFRGVENQLYRVQITDVSDAGARFLWSRENGSVTAAWIDTEADRLVVDGVRDRARGFAVGDWAELTWAEREVAGVPGPRVRIVGVEAGLLTYEEASATGPIPADPRQLTQPIVRRWDARPRAGRALHAGAVDVAEGIEENDRIRLEDGIEIQFQPAEGVRQTVYRVGDYWTIPARVATGDIIWPRTGGVPDAVPPQGVRHHYAPLALIGDADAVTDLRRFFAQLAEC